MANTVFKPSDIPKIFLYALLGILAIGVAGGIALISRSDSPDKAASSPTQSEVAFNEPQSLPDTFSSPEPNVSSESFVGEDDAVVLENTTEVGSESVTSRVAGITETLKETFQKLYDNQAGRERSVAVNDKQISFDIYNKAKNLFIDLREDGTYFKVQDHGHDVFRVDYDKNVVVHQGAVFHLLGRFKDANGSIGEVNQVLTAQDGGSPLWQSLADTSTGGLNCTDCLNETQIEDIYLKKGGDTSTGALVIQNNLTVTGTTTLNGATYTWPGADGSPGQLLSSNGSGVLSWTDNAGGGEIGAFGGNSVEYTYSTTTTDEDPASGNLRLNDTDLTAATEMYLDEEESNAVNILSWLQTLDNSSNEDLKGYIRLFKENDPSVFYLYELTTVTEQPGGEDETEYVKLTVSYVAGAGTLSNSDSIVFSFSPAGERGSNGAAAYLYVAYASDTNGSDFTLTFDADLDYIAILPSDTLIEEPEASDFTGLWKLYGDTSGSVWGSITGTLADQTDLQAALDVKADEADLLAHIANTDNPHSVTAAQAGAVALTGDETIAGIKTFSAIPVGPGSDPTTDNQLVRKAYVDGIAAGLSVRQSVRVATTANITLSGEQTIDGVSAVTDDRVLVKNQDTASANGIYIVASGSWTRATDYDSGSGEVVQGSFTSVLEGTTQANTQWALATAGSITVGSTSLTFTQLSAQQVYTASLGVKKSGLDFQADLSGSGAITLTGNSLQVAVDDQTIERSGNALQVKGLKTATITGDTTLTTGYNVVLANNSSNITVTLPAASSVSGRVYQVKKVSSNANTVTIDGAGSDTIDGALSHVLYIQHDEMTLVSNGSTWNVLAQVLTAHMAKMTRNAAQTIPSSTSGVTKLAFDNEEYDIGAIADVTTNDRITIKRAGKYLVSAYWRLGSVPDQKYAGVQIHKNGSAIRRQLNYASGSTDTDVEATEVLNLAAGDYIEAYARQTTGTSRSTTTTGSFIPRLSVIEFSGSGGANGSGGGSGSDGNTLDQSYDQDSAGGGRSITADSGAVSITVPDTSDNAALEITQNDTTNNPNGLVIVNTGTGYSLLVDSGDAAFDANVIVGGSTSRTETIAAASFSLGGNDLFVAGDAGIEGLLYLDGGININDGAFAINSSGAITAATGITSSGTITLSGLDCTGNENGGALTADASGVITCTDDDSGEGGSSGLPQNYVSGYKPTLGADTAHDISFTAGSARSSDNTTDLVTGSALVKQIDATFAAGTNAGGLSSSVSLSNNMTLHAFAIYKTSDESIDIYYDSSVAAANIPSGYTKPQLIFSFKLDGSQNIIPFESHEMGNILVVELEPPLGTQYTPINDGNITLDGVPTGLKLRVRFAYSVQIGEQFGRFGFHSPDVTVDYNGPGDDEDDWLTSPILDANLQDDNTDGLTFGQQLLWTNTSAQITFKAYQPNTSLTTGTVESREYWIPRGQIVTN
ncbi:MAG: hypothetical protein WD200_04660 [Candidatus Andersenbacteria bacterium]